MPTSVIINAKAASKVVGGYPWVFEGDVVSRKLGVAGIVGVHNKRGEFLGQAFYSPASKISLRMITRSRTPIDASFWRDSLRRALERRKKLFDITNAYRVVHSESDGFPSITIDRYADIVSFQITSAGAETVKDDIVDAIKDVLEPRTIIEKNGIDIRKREGLALMEKAVFGENIRAKITEGELVFEADILEGQKTGAYLDYRDIRMKAAELAKGNALDMFCYQGWLACRIAKKCKKVVAVDASKSAIDVATQNAENNSIDNVEFICADAFEWLASCKKKFEFIHLDPPPFAKGHDKIAVAMKGYEKLTGLAVGLLKKGGILLVSSCSHHISERVLENAVVGAFQKAGKKFEIVHRGIQSKDHPVLKGFPESLYLKAVAGRMEAGSKK